VQAGADTAEGQIEQCWTLTKAAAESFIRTAKAGDRVVYAVGSILLQTDGVKAITRAADLNQLVLNFRRRSASVGEWIATRKKPAAEPAPAPRRPIAPQLDFDEAAQLLALLQNLARNRRPCPVNRQLGDMLGGSPPERVSYLLRKLVANEQIGVEQLAGGLRVVTIRASGLATARPQ
jgi:hypothetical protein